MISNIAMKQIPLDIVGSTVFGRYPKISLEQTFNFIISDNWLVPFAGYETVATISQTGVGRGIYSSTRYQHLILVIDNGVYTVTPNLSVAKIASIDTFNGDVFIDENNANQIAICDKEHIYIFNYGNNTFQKADLDPDFQPGYITFQDGNFIAPNLKFREWRISDPNDGLVWPADPSNVGEFQTKPDIPLVTLRFPGKGNLLFVMGSTVTETWYDVGGQLFPYQKNTYANIDYGCLNAATVASGDDIVVWLGANEKSGPVIMFSDGGPAQQISTDGINFRFAELTNPQNSYGFLFKQDGHVIYQITFPDDNLSLIYDFTTEKIFTVCDENQNYHIAKKVVFFNNSYYFVSINDGNLYEMSSDFTTYDGKQIPRIRICKSVRLPDSSRFVVNNMTFPIEQGESHSLQRVDLSVSKNGGQSFGSVGTKDLNAFGHRQNQLNFWKAGMANDFIPQFRFVGEGRFVVSNGVTSIYQ